MSEPRQRSIDYTVRVLSEHIRVRCPHCNRSLDLTDFTKELLRRMLIFLRYFGKLNLHGIGKLRVTNIRGFVAGGWGPIRGHRPIDVPPHKQLYFRSTVTTRKFINTEIPEDEVEKEPWLKRYL